MKAKAIEIRWHDTQPIFSADFHSLPPEKFIKTLQPFAKQNLAEANANASASASTSAGGEGDHSHARAGAVGGSGDDQVKWRLATAGGDKTIRMWLVTPRPHVSQPLGAVGASKLSGGVQALREGGAKVEYLATLNKHNAVVNVVRWSPDGRYLASAGDDGQIILWRERETGSSSLEFGESADEYEKEGWVVLRMMTNQGGGEVYDLSWSPDSSKLICGSMDHTFTVWDIATGRPLHRNKDHSHYVQGVAWDPLDQFIATQSSDRSMHVYQMTNGGPSDFELKGVGKRDRIDVQHSRGGTWDQPPPLPPQRSRSHNSATGGVPPSPNGKGRMIDRPMGGSHHRSLSRDSSHSDVSRASLAETLAGASASIAGGSAIADADEESTPMDPPNIPVRPSSRRSSTAGSVQSPGLTAAALNGFNRPMRSPSPAPLPAIMPPSSPKLSAPLGPPPLGPRTTSDTKASSWRLYADPDAPGSTPFFRRLDWSPDGSLLLTPAGLFEDPYAAVTANAVAAAHSKAEQEGTPSMQVKKPKKKDDPPSGPKPTVYVYSRANLARPPVAHLPGHKTTSIGVRFCPVLWKLRKWRGAEDDVDVDETAAEEDPAEITLSKDGVEAPLPGAGEGEPKGDEKSLFELPYRMVYAVATLDAVFLYDTQQAGPIAMFGNLHYAPFTDLSWSADGQTLVVSSQDGYCSIISFEPCELGTPYEGPRREAPPVPIVVPPPAPAAPIPEHKVPVPAPLAAPKAEALAQLASVPQKRDQPPGVDGVPKEKKKAKRANLTTLGPAGPQPLPLVQTKLTNASPQTPAAPQA